MPTVSADETVEGPNPEGLNRSHRNTRVLEEFAQSMSEDLIQSFKSQIETLGAEGECLAFRFNQNQEVLAEVLASAVMEVALREAVLMSRVQLAGRRMAERLKIVPSWTNPTSKDPRR